MDARTWILVALVSSQVVEQVVVNVNGDIITRTDIDERVRVALAQQRGRPVSAGDLRADPELQAQASAVRPRLLAEAIDELLVVQWGRDRGLEADDEDAGRVIAQMRIDNKIETDEAFEALLAGEGISNGSLRQSVRRQITTERVRQRETNRVLVRDSEARDYYHRHPDEFVSAPRVSFREILVALPGPDRDRLSPDLARQYDAGLIRFVAVQDRIKRGDDFATVARELSEAPSKADGGAVGPVDPASLAPAVKASLLRLAAGQVSAPVRTVAGYVLVKLDRITPAVGSTFEAWRDEVVRRVQDTKRAHAFAERLNDLRAQAVIEWKDRELEAACANVRPGPCRTP